METTELSRVEIRVRRILACRVELDIARKLVRGRMELKLREEIRGRGDDHER